MRALGEQRDAREQPLDFGVRGRMAEYGQGERRLGDEHIARHRLERCAGGIGGALVIAADHRAAAAEFHHHLRAAEYVARRHEPQRHLAGLDAFTPTDGAFGFAGNPAGPHQRQRRRAGEHGAIAGARMVGMGVRDDGLVHRADRIDEEAAGLAIKALRQHAQPGFGMRRGHPWGKLRFQTSASSGSASVASAMAVARGQLAMNHGRRGVQCVIAAM